MTTNTSPYQMTRCDTDDLSPGDHVVFRDGARNYRVGKILSVGRKLQLESCRKGEFQRSFSVRAIGPANMYDGALSILDRDIVGIPTDF